MGRLATVDDPDRWERYRQMTNIPGCFNAGDRTLSITELIASGPIRSYLVSLRV